MYVRLISKQFSERLVLAFSDYLTVQPAYM